MLAGPDFARQLVPSFAQWIRDGGPLASVQVDYCHHGGLDQFIGTGKLPNRPLSASLTWTRGTQGPEPALSASPERQTKLKGAWRGPWSENPQGWLVVGYGPFRRLTGHAAEAQRAMVGPHHVRRLVSLFYEDASLKEVIEWLKNQRLRELEKRAGAQDMLEGVISLLNSGLLPDHAAVERVDSEGLWVQRDGSTIELRELSDGYRVALALVLDLIRHMEDAYGRVDWGENAGQVFVDMPGVVLIDEVDAHLHVSWQQNIGTWLQARFPKVQFLVTTHSPFVCQAARENGIFRLPAPGEEAGVQLVDEDTYRRVVNGTVGDAVLSDLFGLERSESPKAARLREEWSKLQAKRVRTGLNGMEKRRYDELAKQLPLPFEQSAAE